MKPMTTMQTLVWSVVLAAGWVGLQVFTTDERDLLPLLFTGAFFFVIAFSSMRLSSRVTSWAQRRNAKPPPPPPESLGPTTERPEHAQRRRGKRRKRPIRRKR
jgi:hypothetical protein